MFKNIRSIKKGKTLVDIVASWKSEGAFKWFNVWLERTEGEAEFLGTTRGNEWQEKEATITEGGVAVRVEGVLINGKSVDSKMSEMMF